MSRVRSVLLFGVALCSPALSAQDTRDDDIFGEQATQPAADKAAPAADTSKQRLQTLVDTMQIGGRLELRSATGQEEQQKLPEASFTQLKTADIYFDTRPNKDMRVFLRTRFEERRPVPAATPTATASTACTNCVDSKIDELWFKWTLNESVFFTYGKQHLKWGSSRFWNPSDFTARETRDPFSLFDRRLGQELLKIHIPQEKAGNNYYAILQFDDMKRDDDILWALRGEFAVGSSAELALSLQSGRQQPQRVAIDLSSALGPFDANVEAASSRRVPRQFYSGKIEDSNLQPTRTFQQQDKSFEQVTVGLRQSWQYSDEDNLTWGVEGFWNELGYEERDLELYSLVTGQSQGLYSGRRYAGIYALLPNPGSWNETSFFANAIGNLADESYVGRLTGTWEVSDAASFEAYVSRCVGDLGELCFKVPEQFKIAAKQPNVSPIVKQVIAQLPARRTLFTAGAAMSIVF